MTPPRKTQDFVIPVAALHRASIRSVEILPDAETLEAIGAELDLLGLRKLRLTGRLAPLGKRDWRFEGQLGATVVQACVVTLAPVATRIDEPVARSYVADWQPPEGEEVELPEDVDSDPLGAEIDLRALLVEALALALPAWPRAEGADLGEAVFTGPGERPMTDTDARPFAGLAGLRDKLSDPGDTEDG